jgi:hypothetical protein
MTDRYAIVTEDYYYNSYSDRTVYERFSEYDYKSFEKQVRILTLSGKSFRAFRITPITITTTVNINIGQ